MTIRSLISAKLRFHQAYIFQKMYVLEVWAHSSAFVSLSIFKECSSPSSPEQTGKMIQDSKRGIKAYPDAAIFEDNLLKKSE